MTPAHARSLNVKVVEFRDFKEIPEVASPGEVPSLVIIDPVSAREEQALVSLLRRKLHKTVPILVVSSAIDTVEAFAQGATALITKPIDAQEFLIAVKELISAKGWRILVADRNMDLRILIKRSLEQRGFKVDDVDRGKLVLNRLEQEEYDLVLIDMSFPDVSGVEVLKVIRRDRRFKRLPVFVMLDEDKNPPSREELISWGADQFVGKYRGIGGIVDAVCQYLEDKKIIEQNS